MARDLDSSEAATPPGLVYVSDRDPGISRRRRGRGFTYLAPDGSPVRGAAELARIDALAIPPAYERVWICLDPNGHLQATGFDDRRRKQYRYHPDWSAWRSGTRFGQLAAFGAMLGRLRARVRRDLRHEAGDFDFSLAALVTLLDRTHLRIGNSAYARDNRTYGASTLLARHLRLADGEVRLTYRAKGGKWVEHRLRDRHLHRVFQAIGDLPGRNLFTWLTPDGEVRTVASQDVNAYLAAVTGIAGATAKTFRTWGGSLAAFGVAEAAEGPLSVRAMTGAAAERLHNTPAVCRTAYIHPEILALAALAPDERRERLAALPPTPVRGLRRDEQRLLAFLAAPTPTLREQLVRSVAG